MQVLSWRALSLLTATWMSAVLISGCGGGDGTAAGDSATPPAARACGSVAIAIAWPPPSEMSPQLIPALSTHLMLTVVDAATGNTLVTDVLAKPTAPPWVSEASYEIPSSPRALLSVQAFPADPREDPQSVPQAAGDMHVVVPAGKLGYPLGGAPGDAVRLTLNSTVSSVRISPASPARMLIESTLQLVATAYDPDGSVVLVPGFDWRSSTPAVTVDNAGRATGHAIGQCSISAAEVEGGVSGSVVVEVVNPAILGRISGLSGGPQALVTIRVTRVDTGELAGLTRSGPDGLYRVTVPPHRGYRVLAEKCGYLAYDPAAAVHQVRVENTDVADVDFGISGPPVGPGMGEIRGFVYSPEGAPVEGVAVSAGNEIARTDRNGEFVLTLDVGRTYRVIPRSASRAFAPTEQEVALNAGTVHVSDFVATPEAGAAPVPR